MNNAQISAQQDLGEAAWADLNPAIEAAALLAQLQERHWKLACAESLTGGMITSAFVDIPGASRVLHGGAVTYTDAIKTQVLGVEKTILESKTAYSAECALAMAQGARRIFAADVALASTGVAGPGSDLGFVAGSGFLAAITPETSLVWSLHIPSNCSRQTIRAAFVRGALALLHEVLLQV